MLSYLFCQNDTQNCNNQKDGILMKFMKAHMIDQSSEINVIYKRIIKIREHELLPFTIETIFPFRKDILEETNCNKICIRFLDKDNYQKYLFIDVYSTCDIRRCDFYTEYITLGKNDQEFRINFDKVRNGIDNYSLLRAKLAIFKEKHLTMKELFDNKLEINLHNFLKSFPRTDNVEDTKAPLLKYYFHAKLETLDEIMNILSLNEEFKKKLLDFYSCVTDLHSYCLSLNTLEVNYNLQNTLNITINVEIQFNFTSRDDENYWQEF